MGIVAHPLRKNKVLMIVCVVLGMFVMLKLVSPFAFARDRFLTKMKVSSYDHQYDLGLTLRHDEDIQTVYLFCLGFEPVSVECDRSQQDTRARQIFPFLYKWELCRNESAYRVTIGDDKYYISITSV